MDSGEAAVTSARNRDTDGLGAPMKLLTGNSNRTLAQAVASHLDLPLTRAQVKRFPDNELLRLADMVLDVVPTVLKEQGKAKSPAPNVDAISGTLQYYYGVREFDFYTVLFGVGRALGVTANYIWARALGQPIERPKSMTTKMLEDVVTKAAQQPA